MSVVVMVGAQVFAVAAATAWAIGGLFELGSITTTVVAAILLGFGVYGLAPFARRVWQTESELATADQKV